jgi:hypothetical protein
MQPTLAKCLGERRYSNLLLGGAALAGLVLRGCTAEDAIALPLLQPLMVYVQADYVSDHQIQKGCTHCS